MAFFAKFRRKLRTKNFKAHFHRKLRTLEKCSNVKKLRTAEPQPILLVLLKKNITSQIVEDSDIEKLLWNLVSIGKQTKILFIYI